MFGLRFPFFSSAPATSLPVLPDIIEQRLVGCPRNYAQNLRRHYPPIVVDNHTVRFDLGAGWTITLSSRMNANRSWESRISVIQQGDKEVRLVLGNQAIGRFMVYETYNVPGLSDCSELQSRKMDDMLATLQDTQLGNILRYMFGMALH